MFNKILSDFFSLLIPKRPIRVEPHYGSVEATNECGETVILEMSKDHLSDYMPVCLDASRHEPKNQASDPPLEV